MRDDCSHCGMPNTKIFGIIGTKKLCAGCTEEEAPWHCEEDYIVSNEL